MQLASFKVFHKSQTQNSAPTLYGGQLLRSCPQLFEEGGYIAVALFYFFSLGVNAADSQASLSGMARLFGNPVEHQWAAGDGLGMLVGVGKPDEQAPPVVNSGGDPGHEPAAFDVLGGKASPTPVIFEFIKIIFGIGTVPVQLGDTEHFIAQGGHQHTEGVQEA